MFPNYYPMIWVLRCIFVTGRWSATRAMRRLRLSTIMVLIIAAVITCASSIILWIGWTNRGSTVTAEPEPTAAASSSALLFVIGEVLAVTGNICIACGLTLQKWVANTLAAMPKGSAPESSEYLPFWIASNVSGI